MVPEQLSFIAHGLTLVIFAVTVGFAGQTFSELRNTSANYNDTLLHFAYFSLSSWILWVSQYAILLAVPFTSLPSSFFSNFGLWLRVMQNALWASAVLSLLLKQFSRTSLTWSLLIVFLVVLFPAVIGLVTYEATFLTSGPFTQIDTVTGAVIFWVFAVWIVQLALSTKSAAVFLIHGCSQWIWGYLWLPPLAKPPILLLAFPFWHITLLVAWIALISEMVQRAQPSYRKFGSKLGSGVGRPELPNFLIKLKVMISSTVEDLRPERDAADRAIRGLRLTRFRAETLGSVSHSPKIICALLAEQCDIFVLIIGERYGYMLESEGISFVEFEFNVARAQNSEKILVYVKDDVERQPRLTEFLQRVGHPEDGYLWTSFKSADNLGPKVQGDIARWLASRIGPNDKEK